MDWAAAPVSLGVVISESAGDGVTVLHSLNARACCYSDGAMMRTDAVRNKDFDDDSSLEAGSSANFDSWMGVPDAVAVWAAQSAANETDLCTEFAAEAAS